MRFSATNIYGIINSKIVLEKLIYKKLNIEKPKKKITKIYKLAKSCNLHEYTKNIENCQNTTEKKILTMQFGTVNEQFVIDEYKKLYGYEITKNKKLVVEEFGNFEISGIPDGYVTIDDKKYIVEIKTRVANIKPISANERVQILIYCNLANVNGVIFIQCLNNELHITKYEDYKNDYNNLWKMVISRLNIISTFLDNVDNTILTKNDVVDYDKLAKKIYWCI